MAHDAAEWRLHKTEDVLWLFHRVTQTTLCAVCALVKANILNSLQAIFKSRMKLDSEGSLGAEGSLEQGVSPQGVPITPLSSSNTTRCILNL